MAKDAATLWHFLQIYAINLADALLFLANLCNNLPQILRYRLGQLEKFRLFQIRLELELHSFSKLD